MAVMSPLHPTATSDPQSGGAGAAVGRKPLRVCGRAESWVGEPGGGEQDAVEGAASWGWMEAARRSMGKLVPCRQGLRLLRIPIAPDHSPPHPTGVRPLGQHIPGP